MVCIVMKWQESLPESRQLEDVKSDSSDFFNMTVPPECVESIG